MARNSRQAGRHPRTSARPPSGRLARRHRLDRLLRSGTDPHTGQPLHGFETEHQTITEDMTRIRLIASTIRQIGNCDHQGLVDRKAARQLRRALRRGIRTGKPTPTLASFFYMRDLRLTVIGAILEAVEPYPNSDLRIVTIINQQWLYSADQLNNISAATIKRQFRTHLERKGILSLPGFLIAFLHGEFEPTGEKYQLHFHIITTEQKAELMMDLVGGWGYSLTETGANPIVRNLVNDRPRQFSYLMKAYWPEKPIVMVDGKLKRTRTRRRIKANYHTQYLLWLAKQSLSDIMLLNGMMYRGGVMHFKG